MEEIKIHTAGDSSVLIEFGQEISPEINAKITAFVHLMKAQHVEGVKDMIPAFTSLLINYDPRVVNYGALKERLEKLLRSARKLLHHGFLIFRSATVANMDLTWKISQCMPIFLLRK